MLLSKPCGKGQVCNSVWRSFFAHGPGQRENVLNFSGFPMCSPNELHESPRYTIRQRISPLNQEKRLWNIVGKVVIDSETVRKYHVSACKEPTGHWALVGVHVDDRTVFFDKKILEALLPEWYDDPAAWESPIH